MGSLQKTNRNQFAPLKSLNEAEGPHAGHSQLFAIGPFVLQVNLALEQIKK